jgi:hypothetical protein
MKRIRSSSKSWRAGIVVVTCLLLALGVVTPASAAGDWQPLPPNRDELWSCTDPEVRPFPGDGQEVWLKACVTLTADRTKAQAWAVVGNNRTPGGGSVILEYGSVNLHNEFNQQPISHGACDYGLVPDDSYVGCSNPTVPIVCDDDVWAKISVQFIPGGPWQNLQWRMRCR